MNMHPQLFVLERCNNKFNWQVYSTGKRLKNGFVRDTAKSISLCCFLLFSASENDKRPQQRVSLYHAAAEIWPE